MRLSQFPVNTLKESPADAELISHKLMLRAGLIRRLASGLYTWMPLGLRVLRKVEGIVRDEMNRAGAVELLMPTVQPAELWQESMRWAQYGPELLRLKDRHDRDFCFGPTHEEVITDLARRELRSYKQVPVNYYQIQTKFRDEVRPRFGVMRAREFLMKDAYSFHIDQASLEETYQRMYEAYSRIFTRIGLDFRPVQADTGSIGGNKSHEFHVLADSGEDAIAFSADGQYAANVELAAALPSVLVRPEAREAMAVVATPGKHSIGEVSVFLNVAASQCVKTLLLKGATVPVVALVLRGDHELNLIKAGKFPQLAQPVSFAEEADVIRAIGCKPGSLGPVGLIVPMLVDHAAAELSDFICGANQDEKHLTGVNWGRDLPEPEICDLRKVCDGDLSPDGKSTISIRRGIEVGHIFQLGDKYSRAMKAEVLDEQANPVTLTMGCYGIGVSRVVAAAIEQSYDDKGIIWPMSIAPFKLAIAPLNMHKSDDVKALAESLYSSLIEAGHEVLMDDRDVRAGAMFADLELIGIPHRITIGDRGIKKGVVEYQARDGSESSEIPLAEVVEFLSQRLV